MQRNDVIAAGSARREINSILSKRFVVVHMVIVLFIISYYNCIMIFMQYFNHYQARRNNFFSTGANGGLDQYVGVLRKESIFIKNKVI